MRYSFEAIDSAGRRFFRSWTSTSLAGTWTAKAHTQANPLAGLANMTFPSGQSTTHILQYLDQGRDPASGGDYSSMESSSSRWLP